MVKTPCLQCKGAQVPLVRELRSHSMPPGVAKKKIIRDLCPHIRSSVLRAYILFLLCHLLAMGSK